VKRLQKFVEKGPSGEGPFRTAYVLGADSLPKSAEGTVWQVVETFRAGDELLDNPDLKDAFKTALEKGCAIVAQPAQAK
jgi:hypothetical protein